MKSMLSEQNLVSRFSLIVVTEICPIGTKRGEKRRKLFTFFNESVAGPRSSKTVGVECADFTSVLFCTPYAVSTFFSFLNFSQSVFAHNRERIYCAVVFEEKSRGI